MVVEPSVDSAGKAGILDARDVGIDRNGEAGRLLRGRGRDWEL